MSRHLCPECDSDRIVVSFTGTCLLTAGGSEDCGDHEYDSQSPACCQACGFSAQLADFPEEDDQ